MKVWNYNMEKATNLIDLKKVLSYYPLNNQDVKQFYINTGTARGIDVELQLTYLFDRVPDAYQQVVFLGHKGLGKSTLIYKVSENLQKQYTVISYSVQDDLNMSTLTFVDVLYSLYMHIYANFEDQLEKNFPNLLEEVKQLWYGTIEKEIVETKSSQLQAEAGIGLSLKILFAKIKAIFQAETLRRDTIRRRVTSNIQDFIDTLNKLIDSCSKYTDKPILVIVDDLEKMTNEDDARRIFIELGMFFREIKLRLLLTAPVSLQYIEGATGCLPNYYTSVVLCPAIKVYTSDRKPCTEGVDLITRIIYARIEDTLIEPSALSLAISNTGGLLRDLFEVIFNASILCQISGQTCIKHEHVLASLYRLQAKYLCAYRETYKSLIQQIAKDPFKPIACSTDFISAVQELFILEYSDQDGRTWRAAHPVIEKYLSGVSLDKEIKIHDE